MSHVDAVPKGSTVSTSVETEARSTLDVARATSNEFSVEASERVPRDAGSSEIFLGAAHTLVRADAKLDCPV